ncbi:hypothetical protein [Flavobacterium terrigena]|uniref:Uncharacterized protein n=1 Tax=Flavobacterium terrigena TaxID=402734 RepID=A0A1H6SMA2_9FLAO|nr:hypothetical protein [Flavobacterium terrigena]SEI69039.1 hypothetical protein SAMN05660918_1426 [Flavobacterium terrigena]
MASTSEVGHAKNIANLNVLNTNIAALGAIYNPSNPKLALANLQNLYTSAVTQQENVNNLVAPYSIAVDERELIFKPLNSDLTKLRKAYKATEGVSQPQLEDFMTIVRKLKGVKKTKLTTSSNPEEEQLSHSTSQMSYDQRTNNMDVLISLLQNTPNYGPNETEYKIETYLAKKTAMLQKTQDVLDAYIPLNNARSSRNNTLYISDDNLVDLANKAKDYLYTILDANSAQYKAISKIKFKKQ